MSKSFLILLLCLLGYLLIMIGGLYLIILQKRLLFTILWTPIIIVGTLYLILIQKTVEDRLKYLALLFFGFCVIGFNLNHLFNYPPILVILEFILFIIAIITFLISRIIYKKSDKKPVVSK